MKKELKDLSNEELVAAWKYYKPKAKRLGKEEYKRLIEIEREMNIRKIGVIKEITMVLRIG